MHRSLEHLHEITDDKEILAFDALDALHRQVVELSPIAAFVVNAANDIAFANQPLRDLLDCDKDEPSGSKFSRIAAYPGSGQQPLRAADLPDNIDLDLIRADGGRVPAEVFHKPLQNGDSLLFAVDLTDRQNVEQSHIESEKKQWQSHRIEALGRLAGGVAHDFNNFLAVLLLHLDILNLQLSADSPARERVREIKEVANSISLTVRQLFAFGRKQPMSLAPVNLNPVVADFVESFRGRNSGIDIEIGLDPELGICFVDSAQITQVLENLAVNASEAMPNGGTLRVTTANILLNTETPPGPQPAGPYVEIAVTDTGIGMEPSTEEYIFEPFFSTKESDKGAGLALAMVYGIVKQSKGFIWVTSEVGKGTTFKIQFPRIDLIQPVENREPLSNRAAGLKTVLIVDDEPAVRRITAEFLKMANYKVLEAGSGLEALEIAQAHFDPIHVLLTDLYMPLMDGRQAAERIAKLHPETAVLFMSGNAAEEVPDESDGQRQAAFISKPFSSTGLTEKVRALIAEHRV